MVSGYFSGRVTISWSTSLQLANFLKIQIIGLVRPNAIQILDKLQQEYPLVATIGDMPNMSWKVMPFHSRRWFSQRLLFGA
jgi:hypothetical protein